MNTSPIELLTVPRSSRPARSSHDFDFWLGSWKVENRRRAARLGGCDEWDEFEATSLAWPILNGLGNMDEFLAPSWNPGYIGMTLRLFNPATAQWSISWMDNLSGVFEPPAVGAFQDGVGTFLGRDTSGGEPVDVRFIWSEITAESARWEQAFSGDGRRTWETNWIRQMRRTGT